MARGGCSTVGDGAGCATWAFSSGNGAVDGGASTGGEAYAYGCGAGVAWAYSGADVADCVPPGAVSAGDSGAYYSSAPAGTDASDSGAELSYVVPSDGGVDAASRE